MQPESSSTVTRRTQRSNSARSRGRPRASLIDGKNTSSSNLAWYSRITEICSSSREPKCANTPDLLICVTSASAPIDRPSRPMCEASASAASRIVARVCWPFCSGLGRLRVVALRAGGMGGEVGHGSGGRRPATKSNGRSILQKSAAAAVAPRGFSRASCLDRRGLSRRTFAGLPACASCRHAYDLRSDETGGSAA